MKNALCERLQIEFPLFAFSHCRDVVAQVSRAGGFGVLGAAAYSPAQLEELKWIDGQLKGAPTGVDVLVPENLSVPAASGFDAGSLTAQIPTAASRLREGLAGPSWHRRWR